MTFADPYSNHIREIGKEAERERVRMNLINHYRTPNNDKNLNVNRIKAFRDIPDGVEILIDYVDVSAIRVMNIPTEIIYESIYRELPELFEE